MNTYASYVITCFYNYYIIHTHGYSYRHIYYVTNIKDPYRIFKYQYTHVIISEYLPLLAALVV